MSEFAPELQSVAFCLNACAGSKARFWELVLTILALSLEERVDSLALLTRLSLFTREIAALDYLRHALLPALRR